MIMLIILYEDILILNYKMFGVSENIFKRIMSCDYSLLPIRMSCDTLCDITHYVTSKLEKLATSSPC